MEAYMTLSAKKEKPEISFNKSDTAFSIAAVICGFLYWYLIRILRFGAGTTIFAVILFAVTLTYMSKSGIKQNSKSLVCMTMAALLTAQIFIFDNGFIAGLSFIMLSAVYVYWVCLSANRRVDNRISVYIMSDAVKQLLVIPFANFGCCAAGINGISKDKKFKKILPAAIGILIFTPFIVAVITLLVSADSAFEEFVNKAFDYIKLYRVFNFIIQVLAGIPVAFYIYGLVYGNIKGRYADRITAESTDRAAYSVRFAPKSAIYAVLTVFNVIYLVFFTVQAVYLFSAFGGSLPEEFSYAEYARRGFFELCAVAVINLGILIVTHLFAKREPKTEPKLLHIQTLITSLFTILLIITALSKMVMYIDRFGLTQLRVFTSWFMVLLSFIFLIICVRQMVRFNSSKLIVTGFVIWFLLLSFSNVDGLIAKYNIERYKNGTLAELDISTIGQLSDAAVPHLYDLYKNTQDAGLRDQIERTLLYREHTTQSDIRQFNCQKNLADKIRAELRIVLSEAEDQVH